MNPVNSRSGTFFSSKPPSDKQSDTGPVEQHAADSKEADGQALPRHAVRSGRENLRRFTATHGKASSSGDTSANVEAEADNGGASGLPQSDSSQANQAQASVAGGSRVRRQASRVQQGNAADQAGEPIGRRIIKWYVSALALFAGYRFIRNPADFTNHPAAALTGVLGFSTRAGDQTLQNANHAVLERFGSYIPADSRCHHVRAELAWGTLEDGVMGEYDSTFNTLKLNVYQPVMRSLVHTGTWGSGLAFAVHEYCHCFTHPQFRKAVYAYEDINESLTEHIKDKIPVYGPFSGFMSKIDSGYDRAKMDNGKNVLQAARELEEAVGEATLLRAYFSGDAAAIRKISRAAVDIYPKRVTFGAWTAVETVGGEKSSRNILAECFVAASLLGDKGKLPSASSIGYRNTHLPVNNFSDISRKQQKELIKQAKEARERLGGKFDQAFYNFDEKAAKRAMKAVHEDLLANWKPVL